MTTESQERNPYIGPRPFEQEDRDFFFGRDCEAGELISLVFAHRALLLYAQSGAGKTSLLNAGLIPLLKEEGFEVLPLARVRGLIPEDIEPDEIPNLYVFNTLMSWAEDETDPRKLAQTSLASFLKEREHPTDEEGLPSPRIIIFDQFEELFAFYPERWRDRERFFEQIRDALEDDPLLRAIFVIREDYIAQLDPFTPLLPEKLRTGFRMERLRKGAALAAVKGPLRDTRRSFAEGVAEQLVEELLKVRVETAARETEEVTGQFIEPVQLQVVCQSLWRDLPPDVTVITEGHLQAFGDVDQALSGFYERSIKEATQRPIVNERDLRLWFERALITPAGTRGTVYRGREETGGIPNTAVDVLENQHLIRGEWRAGARWYELTHDRFIEPIQESNETWREKRRRTVFTALGAAVAALVVILAIAFAATWATQSEQASKIQQVEAIVAAVEVTATRGAQQAAATVEAVGQAATQEAQQSQAMATAAAVELSKADYVRQGLVYAGQGDHERAIAEFTKAIELDPNYAEAYLRRGYVYFIVQWDLEQAMADFTKVIELDPDYAEAYFMRGKLHVEQRNFEQAIADYGKAIELDPNYVFAYAARGESYLTQGNQEQALADFTKAIELDPSYAAGYHGRGRVYLAEGNLQQAIADLTRAIELEPDSANFYYDRGLAYVDQGDYNLAIADFSEAIELNCERLHDAYYRRGLAYYEQGNYDQAIADFSTTIALDPLCAEAYYYRGITYLWQGDYDKAIADFTEAIELVPDYADAYHDRGRAYYELSEYEQAITDFTKAIELNYEPSIYPYYYRGLAYTDKGDYDLAIADFTKAIELDPDYAKSYYYRGLAYANLGSAEKAIADLEMALQLTEPALDEDIRNAARAALERLLPCQLTLLNPHDGATFGPETSEVILEWRFNRSLISEEYFFVDVTYPHDDQIWHDGTWEDSARQIPSGTQETNWILHDYLCQPGFANTGEYSWSVAIKRRAGIAPSIDDEIVCTSSTWVFKWAGCPAPKPRPTPTPALRPTPPYP
jgi:tetratricopeptide (TPR) repeat protein